MAEKQNQKKLIQAFRTFFQKSICPYVSSNQTVMNQWKYFSRLITSEPIDYNQVDYYIVFNKTQNHNSLQSEFRTGNFGQIPKYNQGFNLANKTLQESDKKIVNSKVLISAKKKNLVTCLQNFQNQLLKNQQKLQSFIRKDIGGNQTTIKGINRRPY